MAKYRKLPVVIEAVKFTGNNINDIVEFGEGHISPSEGKIRILTLDSVAYASIGDYAIKGTKGEYYPCEKTIFEATYEKV